MPDLVVDARGLRKVYRDRGQKVVAVNGLDLAVPRGGVHGFLGPNGSGKTTTLRILLGLARSDGGTISMLGEELPGARETVMPRVGAVVGTPSFSPDLTGRRNLSLLASLAGVPATRVDAVLDRVALGGIATARYATYSLGFRQRLGVAAALLRDPELLILDEPSNGLDPGGILDMRELIRDLGESGVTVLLSSHILAEVQQICSSVSIVDDGALLASGAVDELLGERVARTRVEAADLAAAHDLLVAAGYQVVRDGAALLVEGHEHPEQISRVLAGNGVFVRELSAVRPDLETYFLSLTGHRPAVSADPFERAADQTAEHLVVPPHPTPEAGADA